MCTHVFNRAYMRTCVGLYPPGNSKCKSGHFGSRPVAGSIHLALDIEPSDLYHRVTNQTRDAVMAIHVTDAERHEQIVAALDRIKSYSPNQIREWADHSHREPVEIFPGEPEYDPALSHVAQYRPGPIEQIVIRATIVHEG